MDLTNLLAARLQMAFTLGFHIILASLGVGLPVLMLAAEWRFLRTGDELWRMIARRWSTAFLVLFAVGAVSGTVLSFELGLLWPEFMGRWGAVIGLPFTMEGFAFFLEAIFAGIYLYGWNRLSPRAHWWTGWPIAISGFLSAVFVVTANSWMNAPTGFRLVDGRPVDIQPLRAMLGVATGAQVTHMILSAYIVTGFCVAAYYARQQWKNLDDAYSRRCLALSLWLALPLVPLQLIVGDWSARVVARSQPVKLAAMEAQFETRTRAPLHIGGIPDLRARTTRFAVKIPGALSWLAHGDIDAEVLGLNDVPTDETPPVLVVHFAFQTMVAIGVLMLFTTIWGGVSYIRQRSWPQSKLFLVTLIAMGPLSIVAMEAGWTVTEVGRQPWIVHKYMRTADAVTQAPGVWYVLLATLIIYGVIGIATVVVLQRLARVPMKESSHGPG